MKKTGFSLIELLVVIVIIGILSGIGISSFNQYQAKANNIRTISQARQYVEGVKRAIAVEGVRKFNEVFPLSHSWNVSCLGSDNCLWNGAYSKQLEFNNLIYKHLQLEGNEKELKSSTTATYEGMAIVRPPSSILENYVWVEFLLEGESVDCLIRPLVVACQDEATTVSNSTCSAIFPYRVSQSVPYTTGNTNNSGNTTCAVPIKVQ